MRQVRNGTNGHSYEVAGYFAGQNGTTVGGPNNVNERKTQLTAMSRVYMTPQAGNRYNFLGQKAISPSDVWVIFEDDAGGADRPNEDFPDPGDNHGADGGNIVFGDGRAQWIHGKKSVGSFIRGTDEVQFTGGHSIGNLPFCTKRIRITVRCRQTPEGG